MKFYGRPTTVMHLPDVNSRGPLHSGSADLVSMFMARENSVTEIVHPVMIPISTLCQRDVIAPEETLILK